MINSLRVPFEEYDQNIYTQITPPKAGGTPAKRFISHNLPEHMSLIDIEWYDEEDWETATVFENGKAYWCYIYINTDCYEYNLKKAKFYLNGRQIDQGCGYDKKKRYYYLVGSKRFVVSDKVDKPTGFAASSVTSSEISLKWNENTMAEGYVLEKKDGTNWMPIMSTSNTSDTSYKVSGLRAGTAYSFRLKAYIEGLSSEYATLNVNTRPYKTVGMKCGGKTSDSITLQWDKNTSASGYELQKYDGSKWVAIKTLTSNTDTSFTVTNLAPSTTYKFRLRAYKSFGSVAKSYSEFTALNVTTRPYTTTGLKCSSKTNVSINLQWDKNTSASGYELQKYDGSNWVTIKTFTSNADTSFNVTGLKASTTFKFRLRAFKALTNAKSYSEFTNLNVNTRPYTTTGMKCSSKTNVSANLQWNKNISADGYVLDKYDGSKWVTIKTFTSNADTSFNVTGLKASTTFKFRLRAYKNFGSAKEYSAFTYLNVNTRPYTTTGFKMKSATKNAITLQWNKNISASGYCIEKWDGSKWVQIKRYTSNANVTYTATGLKANTAYKFRIRAYKTIGNVNEYSAYSAVVTARTQK